MIPHFLSDFELGNDGIYFQKFVNTDQLDEIKLRETLNEVDMDYFKIIALHHSIPVMDNEVDRFVKEIPKGGTIVDVGGGWGWHWRRMGRNRPDISVVIVDFIKSNLNVAMKILSSYINKTIFLVHASATFLNFDDETFDGFWSVQAIQHIPDFTRAVKEAHRILRKGGVFANYSLNNKLVDRLRCRMLGRKYHVNGLVPGYYFLSLASKEQLRQIEDIFSNKVTRRYTEILFELALMMGKRSGGEKSLIGKFDKFLSTNNRIFSIVARQQSFHTVKANW